MPSITIKNIPEDLLEKIKESSANNRRSMNAEIIFRLEQGLVKKEQRKLSLDKIRSLRTATKRHFLTEAELNNLKNEDRA